jgi:hypothetical protein
MEAFDADQAKLYIPIWPEAELGRCKIGQSSVGISQMPTSG